MRCYICDYSADTPIDVPFSGRKVLYDRGTGREICTHCLEYVKDTLKCYPDTNKEEQEVELIQHEQHKRGPVTLPKHKL